VVLRNYEGMLVRYQAEDKVQTIQKTATRGVSSLIQGSKSVIMPEQNERMERRRLRVLTQRNHELDEKVTGNGCGSVNGSEEELVVTPVE